MSNIIVSRAHIDALRRLESDELQAELARADVVPASQVPDDVVTMHCNVSYIDETTGERRSVTLVYPEEADVPAGRISVLAPVGTALLGLSTGQTIEWEFPRGVTRRLRVLAVERRPVGDPALSRHG